MRECCIIHTLWHNCNNQKHTHNNNKSKKLNTHTFNLSMEGKHDENTCSCMVLGKALPFKQWALKLPMLVKSHALRAYSCRFPSGIGKGVPICARVVSARLSLALLSAPLLRTAVQVIVTMRIDSPVLFHAMHLVTNGAIGFEISLGVTT